MERYTIEDIEIIRRKSGLSYEEAVNLLEYHNGNLAKALVDLERNGRIRSDAEQKQADAQSSSTSRHKISGWLTRLYRARLMVKKNQTVIVNLSILFILGVLVFSPHMLVAGLILSLILGYRITVIRHSADFAKDDLGSMVRNAADNVKQTVQQFAKDIEEKVPAQEDASDERSYYRSASNASAPADRTTSKPDATRPVTVNCPQDGEVHVQETSDGFGEATIR